MKAKDFMSSAAPEVSENDSILDLSKNLRKKKTRVAIVTDAGKPIGIVSVTDILNKVIAEGRNTQETKVKDIMNQVFTIDAEEEISEAYESLEGKGFLSSPVVENGKYIGMLGLHDALRGVCKNA